MRVDNAGLLAMYVVHNKVHLVVHMVHLSHAMDHWMLMMAVMAGTFHVVGLPVVVWVVIARKSHDVVMATVLADGHHHVHAVWVMWVFHAKIHHFMSHVILACIFGVSDDALGHGDIVHVNMAIVHVVDFSLHVEPVRVHVHHVHVNDVGLRGHHEHLHVTVHVMHLFTFETGESVVGKMTGMVRNVVSGNHVVVVFVEIVGGELHPVVHAHVFPMANCVMAHGEMISSHVDMLEANLVEMCISPLNAVHIAMLEITFLETCFIELHGVIMLSTNHLH